MKEIAKKSWKEDRQTDRDRQTERETEEMNMKQLGISQTWCECCIWWYLVRSQASLWWYCFVVILNVWMNGEFRFGLEGNCGSWGKSQQRRCAELSMSVASACVSVCRECFVDVFRQCTVCVCVCHWHLHGKGCKLLPQQTRSQNFSKLLKLLCVEVLEVCGYCRIRPTLLLVHGSAASLTQYLPLAAALNETPGSTSFHFLFTSFHFLCQSHGGFWYDMTILTYPDQMYLWSHFYHLCIWSHWPFWRGLRVQEETVGQLLWPTTVCYLPLLVLRARLHIFSLFLYMSDIMWPWDWVGLFCFVV